jgi:hypothetical protein
MLQMSVGVMWAKETAPATPKHNEGGYEIQFDGITSSKSSGSANSQLQVIGSGERSPRASAGLLEEGDGSLISGERSKTGQGSNGSGSVHLFQGKRALHTPSSADDATHFGNDRSAHAERAEDDIIVRAVTISRKGDGGVSSDAECALKRTVVRRHVALVG